MERFVRSPRFRIEMIETEAVDAALKEGQKRLIWLLVDVNAVILIISGTLGYILAGKTLTPIQEMLEEQKRFVSDASHELRTPLTALKSSLEVALRDKKMNLKEARKVISEGVEETDKLNNLTTSLLELARENKNNGPLWKKIKVKEMVAEAVKNIEDRAKKKGIKILVKTNGTEIKGNKDKLKEVLVILLDNAVKYSSKKGQIIISAKEGRQRAIIKVKDKGMGISEKDLPYIFERFYRADKARGHQEEGGYGLGLAIAKKIIEEHRGRISVESQMGKGSEFKISLPIFS